MEGKATLREIDESYSIDDLAVMNDALDAWHEAQAEAQKPKG
jgi:hypothetical protein